MTRIIRIEGARLTDEVFSITLQTGEEVVWNVTKLREAADAGRFGPPRYVRTSELPAANWSTWGPDDRAKVDYLRTDARLLAEPAIVIESQNPAFLYTCFADGQHRVTARQELGLAEIGFYVVPLSVERDYRVTGWPKGV